MPFYLSKEKKSKVQSSSSLNGTLIIWERIDYSLYIHMNMCILYTRVASNIRVTCTYVSLNKHSTVVTSYLVKVTILSCIMNQLRQLRYSNQPFYIFFLRLQTKKKIQSWLNVQYYKSDANQLFFFPLNVSFDDLRILIYSRWRIYNRIIMLKFNQNRIS
jgi:hypothetical protein